MAMNADGLHCSIRNRGTEYPAQVPTCFGFALTARMRNSNANLVVRSAQRIHDVSVGPAARATPSVGGSAWPNLPAYFVPGIAAPLNPEDPGRAASVS